MKLKVERAINSQHMLNSDDKVIVALSGGADSVALLYALNSLKEKYNITLYACHINHLIRGDEAQRDEDFVTALCENLGIELFVRRVDVPALAKEQKISLELCGRNVRYEFFEELSKKLCAKVATAHTASDNVETVLYNIARGTSLSGLCGIRPVRDYLIRPLFMCGREDVERYCEENSLSYVTDSTNLTDDYTRNNIRHNAVPPLKTVNKELESCVSRMCSSLTEIKNYLDNISFEEINNTKIEHGYDCEKLLSLDIAVLKNSISLIAKSEGVDLDYRHIELIIEALKSSSSVDLNAGKRAVCKQGVFRITDTHRTDYFEPVLLKDCDFVEFISDKELKNINKKLLTNCINCDIITDGTVVRTRQEGDNFTLCDRGVTKSLKKLLNELKIPAEKRSSLLLVADGSTVLWLEGVGVSEQGRTYRHSTGAYIINRGLL